MNDSPLELAGAVKASMPCYIAGDLEVVGPDDPQKECLAVALKACLEIIASRESDSFFEAVKLARKAVELGSKLQ